MSRIKNRLRVNATPYVPKLAETYEKINFPVKYVDGMPIYHNPKTGQVVTFLETTKNKPKGY